MASEKWQVTSASVLQFLLVTCHSPLVTALDVTCHCLVVVGASTRGTELCAGRNFLLAVRTTKLQHINKHMSTSPGPALVCLGTRLLCCAASFVPGKERVCLDQERRTAEQGTTKVSATCLFWFYFFAPSRLGVRPFFLWRRTENALSPKNLKYYIRTYSPRLRFIQIYNVVRRRHDRAASNRRTYRGARGYDCLYPNA